VNLFDVTDTNVGKIGEYMKVNNKEYDKYDFSVLANSNKNYLFNIMYVFRINIKKKDKKIAKIEFKDYQELYYFISQLEEMKKFINKS